MNVKGILFDLDGTLLNTLEDLGGAMNAVLARRGLPAHPISDYRYFVGEGIAVLVRRALPASHHDDATVSACVNSMSEEYAAHCMDKTTPYPGIAELLSKLAAKGVKMAVLSNKPDKMTKFLVGAYFPTVAFDCISGAREGIPRKPHPAGAFDTARVLAIEPEEFLYLGDSKTDMETANAAGMFPVGALWGFRDEGELKNAGARIIIKAPLELLKVLEAC
ncbi:MAG TPA: HAD family hydrolase [Chitinivibrionales bacterium]